MDSLHRISQINGSVGDLVSTRPGSCSDKHFTKLHTIFLMIVILRSVVDRKTALKPRTRFAFFAMMASVVCLPTYALANDEAFLEELRFLRERIEFLEARDAASSERIEFLEAQEAARSAAEKSAPPPTATASAPSATSTLQEVPATREADARPEPLLRPTVVSSGNTGVNLSLSGQVNRGLLFYDDGEKTDLRNVDNDNSSTRVRFVGKANFDEDISLGTNIEVQFESNSSADVSQLNERNVGNNNFTERKLEVYVDSKKYGRVSLGQGDTASNSTSEIDLSGTSVVGYSSVGDVAGSLLFRDDDTGDLTDTDVGAAFSNLDGLSRDDRIRYDTPKLAGFRASTSFIEGDRWDAALRYSETFGDLRVDAGAAYARFDGTNRVNGSFSALHKPTGLSFTAAAGTENRDSTDPFFGYAKLGYQTNYFNFGKTAFAIDAYYGEDFAENGSESLAFGGQAVQNIDRIGTEVYVGARYFDFDGTTSDTDGIFTVLSGARVKF